MVMWLTSSKVGVYGASNSTSTVNDGTWRFVTVVRNSGTYKYYINQNLDVTRTGQDSEPKNSLTKQYKALIKSWCISSILQLRRCS